MGKVKLTAKCKCHGLEKNKEDMFKIVVQTEKSKRTEWYCSENEYVKYKENQQYRYKFLDIVNDIFGRKVINTLLQKEANEIAKVYGYKKIYNYLLDNKYDLSSYICKNFVSEYAEIRYFMAIIKNNIHDYKFVEKEQEVKVENNIVEEVDEDFTPTISRYKKKDNKKRSMLDIMNELED